MKVGVLGGTEVIDGGRALPVSGIKPRAVLTLLGLHTGEVVRAETLVELLWGESPPRTALKALQTHVSSLRRSLGDGVISTRGGGWTLSGADTDVTRYLAECRAARTAATSGDQRDAVSHFDRAVALWRGPPQLPDTPRGSAELTRWAEDHAALVEDRADAVLAAGRAAETVGELEAAVAEAPLRERRWAQLMIALYRAGRQGDALRTYQRARTTLAEELGVEPGTELRKLEAAVVGHDPSLAGPEPTPLHLPFAPRDRSRMRVGELQYARSGDVSIAWQRFGNPAGVPIIAIPPMATCVEMSWELPPATRFFERFGAFGDVVHFDKRGCGGSDRIDGAPGVEERMDDIRAVLDAARMDRAVLCGMSEGGAMAMLFAATYPDRVQALVLLGSTACLGWHPDYQIGTVPEVAAMIGEVFAESWATPETVFLPLFVPSQIGDEAFMRWLLRFQRAAATPRTIKQLIDLNFDIDVRHIVGSISAPTLIVQADRDLVNPPSHSKWLAEHIPGARYASYSSSDHFPLVDGVDEMMDLVEEFVTGELGSGPIASVLSTVMFTDIVDSTRHASALGDAGWRALLDRHDDALRREVSRHRGKVIHSTGDGLLATFDSPARAIRCAHAAIAAVRPLGVDIRAGVHTGEIELRGDDVAGIAVHIGSRVADLARPGEVLASSSVPPLVAGSEITFADRGEHELKGLPGRWHVLATALS
jgi:DNA-binding SARP family transcriptional activator/class 3 adenylate cyclase